MILLGFGFRDGVSEPLLEGVDKPEAFEKSTMKTPHNVVITTINPPNEQDGGANKPKQRPLWMVDGSFLVFRKLEQDVQRFIDLTQRYEAAGCASADQFGAKLMGRWKNGR